MVQQYSIRNLRREREKGVALVEFSLVFLPTLGCILLLLQVAWLVFAWACVQEGVREGVRSAVTCNAYTGLNASIQSVVEHYSFGFVNSSNVGKTFSVHYYSPTDLSPIVGQVKSGDVVNVTVSGVAVYMFAPILHAAAPITIGANSADIMSCPTPATP